MQRYSLFFSPLSSIFQPVCSLFSCVSLKASTFTGDHPSQTGTTLASGSRDLDGKGLKPKGRGGENFHGWDEKYGSSSGATPKQAQAEAEEEGRKGKFIFIFLLLGRVASSIKNHSRAQDAATD